MKHNRRQSTIVTDEEIKQLVLARLRSFPENLKLSIGSAGEFSKSELISHVNKTDEIGKKIIKIHLEYLKSLKAGIFS